MKKIGALLFVLNLVPALAVAGYHTINGNSNLEIKVQSEQIAISGSYEIENKGNVPAINVFPELTVGQWRWTGDPKRLDPDQKETWGIQALVPLVKLGCATDELCAGLNLPSRGQFPVMVRRHYAATDGTRYSAADAADVLVGDLTQEELNSIRAPELDGAMKCSGNGQSFTCVVQAQNFSRSNRTVAVGYHNSQEIRLRSSPRTLTIPPRENSQVEAKFENITGQTGSNYAVLAVLQWEEQGVRHVRLLTQNLRIVQRSKVLWYLGAGMLALLIVALLLYVKVFRTTTARQ
jgi:hypothetical protein